ncbi:unnamed protein product [Musa acuminata subsp. burmannicoides]
MQQKVVMKLSMEDSKKRSKALKAAVGLPGVISAALEGDRMVVVGDGVDSVTLTMVLRKKMGYVELVSVGSAEEKKKDEAVVSGNSWPYQYCPAQPHVYEIRQQANHDPCRIM